MPGESFQSLAAAVGQDEHPLALVGRTDFTRAKYAPRRFVTDACQFFNDCAESKADVSFDVLKEAESGPHKSNSVCNEWPEVAGVVGPESFAGGTEWLAGVATREDVHAATKLGPWEGFKIRPDRCRVQESRFHFSEQIRAGEGFDLTKSDCAQAWDCSLKSEINAAVSGA